MAISRLRGFVRAILLTGTPAVSALVAGCGGAVNDPTPMPERAECKLLPPFDLYPGLKLGPTADGVVIERGAGTSTKRLTIGTPCATAVDPTACRARIDELLASFPAGFDDRTVLSLGDNVRTLNRDELLRAAAPIESLDEAATLLALTPGNFDCDGNNARTERDGWVFKKTERKTSCGLPAQERFYKVTRDGRVMELPLKVLEEADDCSSRDDDTVAGRRPSHYVPSDERRSGRESLAVCFTEIARLEGAAILAFAELERDCAGLGAPRELLARMRRAQADEVAHAAITTRLARRFGGARPGDSLVCVPLPRVPDGRPLLLRLAIENAMEGCVREAYGALVASFQAAHARDAAVRAAFVQIAEEETQHAELSLDLASWLDSRLDAAGRFAVLRAKEVAFAELERACGLDPDPAVVHDAGMPTAAEALALLRALRGAHPWLSNRYERCFLAVA